METFIIIFLAVLIFAIAGIIMATHKIERQIRDDYNRLAAAERKLFKDIGNDARIRNLKHRRIS